LPKIKLGKPWLVQLSTGEKRKINKIVKAYPMDMNGMNTRALMISSSVWIGLKRIMLSYTITINILHDLMRKET
jgi:hypothetical protein